MELGSPHELENCVSNQFRPDSDETWVSATFTSIMATGKAETFVLRRVLKEDYGTTATSTCQSVLFHVSEEVYHDGVVDFAALGPVGRMGRDLYCRTGDIFEMKRPQLER